jgi:hypothetical protein
MRALIIGHFSTVGDIESLEFVKRVLEDERVAYDVAPYKAKFVPLIEGSLSAKSVDPSRYTHLVTVCGPLWPEFLARHGIDLNRFSHCVRIGVNLTMVLPLEQWNPFHVLIERDSDEMTRSDVTFLEDSGSVPVVGLCTIARQREYGDRQRHAEAVRLFRELIDSRGLAAIEIDTRWPEQRNSGGLGSPAEVISVIRRTDVMLTNRLHGMVYALKAGVPALALDPVSGGGKVLAQAKVLGWPAASTVEQASPDWLGETLDWCLSGEGKETAQAIAGKARSLLQGLAGDLRAALHEPFEHRPVPQAPFEETGLARRFAKALRLRR